jgi:hypothetical protein
MVEASFKHPDSLAAKDPLVAVVFIDVLILLLTWIVRSLTEFAVAVIQKLPQRVQ